MPGLRAKGLAALAAAAVCQAQTLAAPAGEAPALDPASGLVVADGWEAVRANCSACHSLKLVTQNRGSRETWASMIRWMQKTQGLWPFDAATEATILDYLARNYAPAAQFRRAPLAPELLPADPRDPVPPGAGS